MELSLFLLIYTGIGYITSLQIEANVTEKKIVKSSRLKMVYLWPISLSYYLFPDKEENKDEQENK